MSQIFSYSKLNVIYVEEDMFFEKMLSMIKKSLGNIYLVLSSIMQTRVVSRQAKNWYLSTFQCVTLLLYISSTNYYQAQSKFQPSSILDKIKLLV